MFSASQRRRCVLAATSLACFVSHSSATDFADAIGDNYGSAYVDIASVTVTNDATNVSFQINLNPAANLLSADGSQIYGKYLIGFQTGTAGSTAIQNPYGNPIGISSGTGMDYWIGSWADNSSTEPFSGGAQLYHWDGAAFVLTAGIGTNEPFIDVPVALAATSTTITVPIANLGLGAGGSFGFDVWSTFGNPGGQSAYDALGKPTQTTNPAFPWDGAAYDSGTAGPGGTSSLRTYTLVSSVVSSAWNVNADGSWTTAANWAAGVPNGVDHTANLSGVITSARTITLDAPQTLGTLNFDNANAYTIASATNVLTLDVSTGTAGVNVLNGSHTISAGLTLADDATIHIANGANTLSVTGTLSASGRSITKTGAGAVQFENVRASSLVISQGAVRIRQKASNHDAAGTSTLSSLTIASGASLNLTNNSLIVAYSGSASTALASVRDHLAAGRLLGAPATPNANVVLGYADNAVLNRATFDGPTVTASSVLIGLTLKGDTNLDRTVNFDDLLALAQSYGSASGGTWQKGDSDYNGAVNFDDLLALAQVYGTSVLADGSFTLDSTMDFDTDWTLAQSIVPEPMLVGTAIGLTLLARRRR